MSFIRTISFILGLFSIFSISHANSNPAIVVSNPLIEDWVQNVVGEDLEVYSLLKEGQDPHYYEPTTKDAKILSSAKVILFFGLGLEDHWLNRLYKSSDSNARKIKITNGLELLPPKATWSHGSTPSALESMPPCCRKKFLEGSNNSISQPSEINLSHSKEYDPHVWLDVKNVILMVTLINDELGAIFTEKADSFDNRASKYITELEALESWIKDELRQIKLPRRKLVTYHDNFRYFARSYGFEIGGDVLGSINTYSNDPSGKHLRILVEKIREDRIPAIFSEYGQNPQLTQQIASEADLPKPTILYTDTLGLEKDNAHTYILMMRKNVTNIVSALKQ